jgi:amino acid transporter
MKRKVFLRWLMVMMSLVPIFAVIAYFGLYQAVFSTVIGSGVVLLILFLFSIASLKAGKDSFKLSTIYEGKIPESISSDEKAKMGWRARNKQKIQRIKTGLHINQFASGFSMGLGMFGTVCGLILAFQGIDQNIDLANFQANVQLLKEVSAGFAAALYTTLVGLGSSLYLSVQGLNIDYEIKKRENE